jgi:RNA polymerase sigma factor (sigma-70 family)
MQTLDDMELLRAYATRNSEAAFEALVARHVHWVYSAALRQVRDPQLAEEVAPAVFTILARKAPTLKSETIMAGWLFNTVRFTAKAELRLAARRRRREQEARMEPTAQAESENYPEWEQIAPLLDQALAQLSERDRHAVLLRYFERKNLAEVGAALGTTEEGVRKRVSRAVEKLRLFFARHGAVIPGAVVVALLSTQAVQAAPTGLAAAAAAAAFKGTVFAGSSANLIKTTLELMAWTKLKIVAMVGAGVLLAAGTVTVTISSHRTSDALSARVERILRQNMTSPGQGQWDAGMDELWSLGPGIIPHLASVARLKDPLLSRAYARLWKDSPAGLRDYLPQPIHRDQLRAAAMMAIRDFGMLAARGAAPAVIDGLGEKQLIYHGCAVESFGWLLPGSASALAALQRGLDGVDTNGPAPGTFLGVDDDTVWARVPAVVPLLANLLGNTSSAGLAAFALGRVGSNATMALPALIQTADQGVAGSFTAAEAARVQSAQDHEEMSANRAMAALALGQIGIAPPEVQAVLLRAWNAPDSRVRGNAALAVAQLGAPMTNELPGLLAGLRDPDNSALRKKLRVIWKLGPGARDALGALRELAQTNRLQSLVADPESKSFGEGIQDLSLAAKMAIWRIDPGEGRSFLPEIVNRIGWWEQMEFLAAPSPASSDVVRAVETFLESKPTGLQLQAAYIILRHDPKHSQALAVLRQSKSVGDLGNRLLAGRLLFKSLGETDGLCSLIAEALRAHRESNLGVQAIQIADEIGDAALPAVPALKAALWHRDGFVRRWAGRLLLKLAPQEIPINQSK